MKSHNILKKNSVIIFIEHFDLPLAELLNKQKYRDIRGVCGYVLLVLYFELHTLLLLFSHNARRRALYYSPGTRTI